MTKHLFLAKAQLLREDISFTQHTAQSYLTHYASNVVAPKWYLLNPQKKIGLPEKGTAKCNLLDSLIFTSASAAIPHTLSCLCAILHTLPVQHTGMWGPGWHCHKPTWWAGHFGVENMLYIHLWHPVPGSNCAVTDKLEVSRITLYELFPFQNVVINWRTDNLQKSFK